MPHRPTSPTSPHHCVVCGRDIAYFLPKGPAQRRAKCPVCGSLERHRFLWLYLRDILSIETESRTILHIAPEPCLQVRLRGAAQHRYVSTDLLRTNVDFKSNFAALPVRSATFDLIIASHVLEHMEDDRAALLELRRVLAPEGVALLQIPYEAGLPATYEHRPDAGPEERRRLLGHWSHRRRYGRDLTTRIRQAGLAVTAYTVTGRFDDGEIIYYGLDSPLDDIDRECIWICTGDQVTGSPSSERPAIRPDPSKE